MKSRSKKVLNLVLTKRKLRFLLSFLLDLSSMVRKGHTGMQKKRKSSFLRMDKSWNYANSVTTLESACIKSHKRR